MIKKFINILAVIAVAACAVACDEAEDSTQSMQDSVIALANNGTEQVTAIGQVTLTINVTKATATIVVPVPTGSSSASMAFKELPISTYNDGYLIKANTAKAIGQASEMDVTDFSAKFQLAPTGLANNILITFTKDDHTTYVATKQNIAHYTSTTTTSGQMGSFTCNNAIYNVVLDPSKNTADIVINNIQFIQQAPTLSEITIPGVPYTKVNGGYVLEADEIIPTSAGVPKESSKLTNIKIDVKASEGTLSGSFNCMGMNCTCNANIAYPN